MGLSGYRAFTDDTVRAIKANLVKGVSVSAVARAYGVSAETISRIRRGLTYAHVRVAGEEGLRPPVVLVPADVEAVRVMAGRTEEEEAEGMEKLREHFEEMLGGGKAAAGMLQEMVEWTETEKHALSMGATEESILASRKKTKG